MIKKRSYAILFMAFIFAVSLTTVSAYTFSTNNVKYNDPLTVSCYISSSIPNNSDVESAYDNWDYMSELDTYRSYNMNYTEAYFVYTTVNDGSYAGCQPIGSSDWKQITIRPAWSSLSTIRRREVVAHEMGHAWGLGHGDSDSLMRRTGFNDDTRPKTDDENGISALY